MKLLTKELCRRIPKLGSTEKLQPSEILIPVKYFNPAGAGTWYVTEGSAILKGSGKQVALSGVVEAITDYSVIEDIHFFGYVDLIEKELGYFSLNELQSIKGKLGIDIERDLHWNPKTTLKQVLDGLKR